MSKYTTLSEEAISYICGLLRDMASVSDAVDDIHLRTDGTFSSVKIDNLIKQVLADGKDYSEQLCSALVKLTCSKTTVQPTLDNAEINVIYLYSADGNSPFEQYLKISDTELIDMGSTAISLDDYYDKTTADSKFAIKSDVTDIINLIGTATLETTDKTLKGAINEVKVVTDSLNTAINNALALRATLQDYGLTKLTDSSDITDSTGLALPATEKNPNIAGTLANLRCLKRADLGLIADGGTMVKDVYYGESYLFIDLHLTNTALSIIKVGNTNSSNVINIIENDYDEITLEDKSDGTGKILTIKANATCRGYLYKFENTTCI